MLCVSSWISHLMHARQFRTLRGRTLHLTGLKDSERLAFKYEERCKYGGKRETAVSDLASAGGAVVRTQGPCLSITELLSIKCAH